MRQIEESNRKSFITQKLKLEQELHRLAEIASEESEVSLEE